MYIGEGRRCLCACVCSALVETCLLRGLFAITHKHTHTQTHTQISILESFEVSPVHRRENHTAASTPHHHTDPLPCFAVYYLLSSTVYYGLLLCQRPPHHEPVLFFFREPLGPVDSVESNAIISPIGAEKSVTRSAIG